MASLENLLRALFQPPVVLVVVGAVGLVLGWLNRKRSGRFLFGGAVVSAVLLSLPPVAELLVSGLQRDRALAPDVITLDADAIVVLGADHRADLAEYGGDEPGPLSLERCRYAARLARRSGLPLLVSGGVVRPDRPALSVTLARFIEDELGVPVRWREERSRSTGENARYSAELLRAEGLTRVALVTHAWHMPRARRAFERAGLEVLSAPTAAVAPFERRPRGFLPSAAAFQNSVWALHEWLGCAWYALRGSGSGARNP